MPMFTLREEGQLAECTRRIDKNHSAPEAARQFLFGDETPSYRD